MTQEPHLSAGAGLEPERDRFAEIYADQHRQLFRLTLLLTGGDRCLSEDVVGQVFLATLPKWRNGTVAEPASYMRRSVVNQVNGTFRRRHTERRSAHRVAERGEEAVTSEGAVDDRDLLWSALRALPAKQRSAVVLRYYEDLSELETARVLGVTVGTVKSQTARGLAKLRNALGELDNG